MEQPPDTDAIARSLALVDVPRMGATIRPRDYAEQTREAAPTAHDLARTRDAALGATYEDVLPDVTLSEPTLQVESASTAPLAVVGVLGEGGMGRILLARQRSLGRDVAVKVLKRAPTEAAAQGLIHEGRLLGSIEHPNILPIHALGSDANGQPALVMKRVDGVAWRDLILDSDHPFWSEVQTIAKDRLSAHLEILMHVAQAVHFAHQHGVVHRDIKAENVIVGRFGEVCLADWGIAAKKDDLAREPRVRVVGTPSHLAPEMARGDAAAIDDRTDVYLLGSTLYEILTGGRARHTGEHLFAVVCAAVESKPAVLDASVPEELAAACNRATAKVPVDRFQSALAFRDAIAEYLRHVGSVALGQATVERQRELELLLESDAPAPDAVYALLSECRFGFRHAMREWPGNESARGHLRECIVLVARFELASARVAAARALIAEIGDPPEELTKLLREHEARERGESDRKRELERLERDVDLTLSATQYTWLFGGLGALITALAAALFLLRGQGFRVGPVGLVVLAAAALTILLAVVAIKRKTLLDRSASRGVVGLLVAIFAGVFFGRLAGLHDGSSPGEICDANSVLAGTCCIAAAFMLRPWFAWLAPIFAPAAAVGAYYPSEAGMAFLLATVLAAALGAFFWNRDQRRQQEKALAP